MTSTPQWLDQQVQERLSNLEQSQVRTEEQVSRVHKDLTEAKGYALQNRKDVAEILTMFKVHRTVIKVGFVIFGFILFLMGKIDFGDISSVSSIFSNK